MRLTKGKSIKGRRREGRKDKKKGKRRSRSGSDKNANKLSTVQEDGVLNLEDEGSSENKDLNPTDTGFNLGSMDDAIEAISNILQGGEISEGIVCHDGTCEAFGLHQFPCTLR